MEHKIGINHNQRNKMYIIGGIIVFKLVLMGLFSSDYQNIMFIPFVDCFLNGNNPYQYYFDHQLLSSFPYFPLMLLIESLGGICLRLLFPVSIFLRNLMFKFPLFVFDLLGYYFIRKIGIRFKYAVIFYFCSPIILYSTYIHSQLDIIPTSLLIAAIHFLLDWKNRKNLLLYAIFLGLALSTKFHILAAVPVFFLYIAKKRDYCTSIKYHLITALVVIAFTAGFWGQGFIETVLFNREQSVLMTISFDYGTTQTILPILALMIIYLNIFELNYFNKNLLLSMLGLLFTVFLICIPPMPAWFTWVTPFIATYFGIINEDKHKSMVVYGVFNFIYLVYFVFLHQTEYVDIYFLENSLSGLKINDNSLKYIVFTLMVSCLIIIVYKIYRFGIASNNLYKRRGMAFTIGIAGDSGAGKTRMLEKIEHLFGTGKDILFIEGDGDHRWARGDENWEQYTALNPQANYLYRQAEDIRALKSGNHVSRVEYDHDLGIFTERKRVTSRKYIVLSGLHSLYLPQLRKELDLKIFMDTDDELRKFWKIQRDMKERGYSKEKIVAQIEKRLPDAEKYIYPQKEFADIVITYFDKTLTSCYEEGHEEVLSVKFDLNIIFDLEHMISCFRQYGVHPEWNISDDLTRQELIFDGAELIKNNIDFARIAEINIPQYDDFFTYAPVWGTDIEGTVQLLLLFMISNKMRS